MEMKCISKLDAGIMQKKCTVKEHCVHSERQITEPINPAIENSALICG